MGRKTLYDIQARLCTWRKQNLWDITNLIIAMQCIVIITIYTKFFPHQACDGMLVISSYDDIIYPLLTYINKAAYIYI